MRNQGQIISRLLYFLISNIEHSIFREKLRDLVT